jgi:hypothetical protein
MDSPFNGQHYGKHYTHVGITLTADGQVQVITEAEAKYRLGGPVPTASPSNNRGILDGLGVKTTAGKAVRPSPAPRPAPAPSVSGNRRILDGIKGGANPTQYTSPSQNTPTWTAPKPKREIPGWAWTVGIIAIVIFLYYASH